MIRVQQYSRSITDTKLQHLFLGYNKKFFGGKIKSDWKVRVDNSLHGYGLTTFYKHIKNRRVLNKAIRVRCRKIPYESNIRHNINNTLVHEMIHAYLFDQGYDTHHTKEFQKMHQKIFSEKWGSYIDPPKKILDTDKDGIPDWKDSQPFYFGDI